MLRKLLFGVFFLAISASPDLAQGGCPAPTYPISGVDSGVVKLGWSHPCALADTCRGGRGAVFQPFYVGNTLNQRRVAIWLPLGVGGRTLRQIEAYYGAVDGVSPELWSDSASISWSVWPDSDGIPVRADSPTLNLALGDNPELRIGRTQTDSCLLPIPYGGAWLVASWPDSTDIVRLGRNTRVPNLPILLGYKDSTGLQWYGWAESGLVVSAIAVDPDSLDCTRAGISQPDSILLIRERLAEGPAVIDTVTLPWEVSKYRDSCLCPGERRVYSAGYDCGPGGIGEYVGFDTVAVPRVCSSQVTPLAISAVLAAGTELPPITVHNLSWDSVTVEAGFPALLSPANPDMDTVCRVLGYPAQATLAPYDSLSIALQFTEGRPSGGEFRGSVALRVRGAGQAEDQYCIPLRVAFDPLVWAPTDPEEHGELLRGPDPLSAWPTFEQNGRVAVRIVLDSRDLGGAGVVTPAVGAGACQVRIVNILGQQMMTLISTLSSVRFIDQERLAAVIEIDGSETWPSGVYACRVTIGEMTTSFPILIAR